MKNKLYKRMNLQFFAMKSKDLVQKERNEILQRMQSAITGNDGDAYSDAFYELATHIQESVKEEYEAAIQSNDANVLVQRGFRQLTSEENKFYQGVINAMKSSNPKQALSDLTVVMPKTTIDNVLEDLETEHPLLESINFQNTSGLVEFLVNTNTSQLAAWGTLTAEIIKELTGGFKKIDMSQRKLSAFLPIAKSMLDLGPVWMDKYIRTVLTEALALGLEEGIVNGTGKDMPIGMNRQVGENVTVTGGIHPEKDTIVITELTPETYAAFLGTLSVGPNGKNRTITEVLVVVNPVDYLTKIFPATTVRGTDGTYKKDVFPFPTKVIQSVAVPTGKAIIGLGKKYFMGIGLSKDGKIDYSDDYRFLEDERVYLIKLYGHGEPLDKNAFIYADITDLKPTVQEVRVVNAADFPIAEI